MLRLGLIDGFGAKGLGFVSPALIHFQHMLFEFHYFGGGLCLLVASEWLLVTTL